MIQDADHDSLDHLEQIAQQMGWEQVVHDVRDEQQRRVLDREAQGATDAEVQEAIEAEEADE